MLNNLGTALWSRHAHRLDGPDLDDALAAFAQAVERTRRGHPTRQSTWTTTLTHSPTAISGRAPRLISTPPSTCTSVPSPTCLPLPPTARASARTSPACLLTQSRESGADSGADARNRVATPGDLDRAVEILEDVVAGTPPGSPALVVRLNDFGVALKFRWERDRHGLDLERGRQVLRQACGRMSGLDVRWGLAAALTLAGWARERGVRGEAADGYRVALALVDQYLRVQLVRESTEGVLRSVHQMYADAADAFVRVGNHPASVVTLERGRAVITS